MGGPIYVHTIGSGLLIVSLLTPAAALANWWIVRASDEKYLVVDVEPRPGKNSVTKIGKDKYQSAEEAEADVKRLLTMAISASDCGLRL